MNVNISFGNPGMQVKTNLIAGSDNDREPVVTYEDEKRVKEIEAHQGFVWKQSVSRTRELSEVKNRYSKIIQEDDWEIEGTTEPLNVASLWESMRKTTVGTVHELGEKNASLDEQSV